MKTPRKTKPKTMTDLAADLGVDRRTLTRWKAEGVEVSEANLPDLRERAGKLKAKSSVAAQIQLARLEKLRAEVATKEHALEVERGRYILKADATVHASRAALTVRAELEKLEDALPPLLEGRSALQMKTRIREYARGVMLELSKCFQL